MLVMMVMVMFKCSFLKTNFKKRRQMYQIHSGGQLRFGWVLFTGWGGWRVPGSCLMMVMVMVMVRTMGGMIGMQGMDYHHWHRDHLHHDQLREEVERGESSSLDHESHGHRSPNKRHRSTPRLFENTFSSIWNWSTSSLRRLVFEKITIGKDAFLKEIKLKILEQASQHPETVSRLWKDAAGII